MLGISEHIIYICFQNVNFNDPRLSHSNLSTNSVFLPTTLTAYQNQTSEHSFQQGQNVHELSGQFSILRVCTTVLIAAGLIVISLRCKDSALRKGHIFSDNTPQITSKPRLTKSLIVNNICYNHVNDKKSDLRK